MKKLLYPIMLFSLIPLSAQNMGSLNEYINDKEANKGSTSAMNLNNEPPSVNNLNSTSNQPGNLSKGLDELFKNLPLLSEDKDPVTGEAILRGSVTNENVEGVGTNNKVITTIEVRPAQDVRYPDSKDIISAKDAINQVVAEHLQDNYDAVVNNPDAFKGVYIQVPPRKGSTLEDTMSQIKKRMPLLPMNLVKGASGDQLLIGPLKKDDVGVIRKYFNIQGYSLFNIVIRSNK